MEEKKFLCRVITGEIIEFSYREDLVDEEEEFTVFHNAKFSHDVTFGGVVWTPTGVFTIKKEHIVYILEKA